MSDYENKNFILPENQQLWMQNKKDNYEIIGYYYENPENKLKYFSIPSLYKTFDEKINNDFNYKILKKNTSENSMLIYDLIQNNNFKNNIIYLSDAIDEENFLKSIKESGSIDSFTLGSP